MKRVFLVLAAAVLVLAEAHAGRTSLLDLIGVGSRRGAKSRRYSAESRKPVRVEHADATNAAAAAAAPVDAGKPASVAALLASTNGEEIATSETAPQAETNAAPAAASADPAGTNAVERVEPAERESRPARISSSKVYYDRKEGYAVFTGRVYVDGEDYQLHAQRAYVFFEGTNELKRVVATGGVAITNDTKRAYGDKASYYRKTGMVVLYGNDKSPAEVRDESKGEDQVVKGSKIKFWIDSEQVEVIDARISAPLSGDIGDLKGAVEGK